MARKYVLGPNAAREFKRLIRGSGEVSRRQNLTQAFAFDSEFVFPFTVQWAQSAAEGEGSWIIWLPGDDIVSVDGVAYDPTDGLDDVGGDYPEGWYLIDGDALDPDEGGKLYLNIIGGEGSNACEFSSTAQTGVDDAHSVVICEASVDAETGSRSVKQFVTSSIIIASGTSGESTNYGCDERSITRVAQESSDPTQEVKSKFFHLRGFGRFSIPGQTQPIGTYQQATSSDVYLDGDETEFAFLCRDVNSSSPDSNELSYRKISFKSDGGGESPFCFVRQPVLDEDLEPTGEFVRKIRRCVFLFDGTMQTLADYNAPMSGMVYLVCTKTKDEESSPGTWSFAMQTSEGQAPSGGQVINLPLYEFDGGKVKVDYRTTFLTVSPAPSGKMIRKVEITPSAAPGGSNSMKFVYTDGSSDTFVVQNGMDGAPGSGGGDGGGSEIEVEEDDNEVRIYVDGELSATIPKGGDAPEITAEKVGKTTTIYADGNPIATIVDGSDGEDADSLDLSVKTVVTGIDFAIESGKLKAKVHKEKMKVVAVSDSVPDDDVEICDVSEATVVTSESYSTSTHKFTNVRKKVKVIGTPENATAETPFEAIEHVYPAGGS